MGSITDDGTLTRHFHHLTRLLVDGRVVPFLGAGANMCGRPATKAWPDEPNFLPSANELSAYLKSGWHGCDETELTRVAQWVLEMGGSGELFAALHDVFDRDYPPTRLHAFLAELPSLLVERGYRPRHPLIVTTNYDDLLEQAMTKAGQPFDLVTYMSDGDDRGKFFHTEPEGVPRRIEIPNTYNLPIEKQPVVLKIHGAVKRNHPDADGDSYVITEDHYIDYLTRTELTNLVPATVAAKLRKSHFLFLGYGLRDWNMRVILHRIAGEQKLTYQSWAIQRNPTDLDQKFWDRRDVDILDIDLDEYVSRLYESVRQLPRAPATIRA
jgi:hypothetical protein